MDYQMRLLEKQADLMKLLDLEREVWGFSEADTDSPLTMKVMSSQLFRMGYTFGLFDEGELIGGNVFFASLVQGRVYGHLVCLKPSLRNKNTGTQFLSDSFAFMKAQGVREVFWTYEPLDAANSTVYINKLGGQATQYISNYIIIEDKINGGVPLDRMICEVNLSQLNAIQKDSPGMTEALDVFPLAGSDKFTETNRILIEIPADYKSLKSESIEEATKVRLSSRRLFSEFINEKGYVGKRLISGKDHGKRRNFYLLEKRCPEKP
jgi:predicted GNAT superfamily acetyltransferase